MHPAQFTFAALMILAQPVSIDPRHQPDDFSNLVGKFDIKVTAEPTDVQVLDPITLRIEISGDGAKTPRRKGLKLFPESWKDDFWIQAIDNKDEVLPDKKTWVFVYRLKPKHQKVKEIADIKLVYYDPSSSAKIKYITKYAEPAIAIRVRPKPDEPIAADVPMLPESFYHYANSQDVLSRANEITISSTALALLLAIPPIACLIGALAWRRTFPDAAQRVRRNRDGAASRALADLKSSDLSTWDIVLRYLHDRFDFSVEDATPAEVAAFLKRRGFAKSLCEQARAYYQSCDAARFTVGTIVEPAHLADHAIGLIRALEADPCARG